MSDPNASIIAVTGLSPTESLQNALESLPQISTATPDKSFAVMLSEGLETVSNKVAYANAMVRDFAVDENVPIHQVTIALEEARLNIELATQVRERFIEAYREIMNMQL